MKPSHTFASALLLGTLAALAARPLARVLRPTPEVEVAVGCFLIAGGLAAIALLPSSELAWTVAPQALVGLGLGLTVDRLTSQAMEMRFPRVEHAGWTIGARHIGVVVGLAILTPVFTADLQDAQVPAHPSRPHVDQPRRQLCAAHVDADHGALRVARRHGVGS